MDNYLNRNRFIFYYATMASVKASQLRNEASGIAFRHLHDFTTRSRFKAELDKFIAAQLQGIKSAKSEAECKSCFENLQRERSYLREQDLALKLGKAKLYDSVELKQTLDGWGYVINGVGLVLSGFQVVAGLGMAATSLFTGNVIGMVGGVMLTLHGINSAQETLTNLVKGRNNSTGFLKDRYIITAEFLGCSAQTGQLLYSALDLGLSAYGLSRFVLKPDAWRLFKSVPSDFTRNFNRMSKTSLTMEVVGDSLTIYSASNSFNTDN